MWYHVLFLIASLTLMYMGFMAIKLSISTYCGIIFIAIGISTFSYFTLRCHIKHKRGKFPEEE